MDDSHSLMAECIQIMTEDFLSMTEGICFM